MTQMNTLFRKARLVRQMSFDWTERFGGVPLTPKDVRVLLAIASYHALPKPTGPLTIRAICRVVDSSKVETTLSKLCHFDLIERNYAPPRPMVTRFVLTIRGLQVVRLMGVTI